MVKISEECRNRKATSHDGYLTWCSGCKRVFCDACYEAQAIHDPDDPSDIVHEKTSIGLAELILSITSPSGDCSDQHIKNLESKWFGVINDETSKKTHFHDFGGFCRLAGGSLKDPDQQFPCLITFVGDTGAGKSTVINGLVKLRGSKANSDVTDTITPVIGSGANLDSPTSGDVHLFADMETYNTERPLFYIDCEGLGGGNNPPMAAQYTKDKSRGLPRGVRFSKGKEIIYVKDKQRSRKWAVEKLYPRILFPFSDVICYVTRNFRKIEEQMEQMLRWADRVFEKAVNQPILPVGVILVNALVSDEKGGINWWDPQYATVRILEKYHNLVHRTGDVPTRLSDMAAQWRMQGKEIRSLKELVSCYFSDFKIICIPSAGPYPPSLIKQQYQKLQHTIKVASQSSWETKKKLGHLVSAEELEHYLEYAFDHFSRNPKAPFNFLEAALFHKPVAETFKSHVCKLAVYFMSSYPDDAAQIFSRIAPLVASSIFLSAYRHRYPGRGVAAKIFETHRVYCEEAQTEFYQRHWRCEERSKRSKVRCVNVASGHGKGHQKPNGKVFAVGDFKSSFDFNPEDERKKFSNLISSILSKLNDKLQQTRELQGIEMHQEEEQAAAEIHRAYILADYAKAGAFDLDGTNPPMNQSTCFCCVASTPLHTLYCGHIICQRCLENYSFVSDDGFYRCLKACPLCNRSITCLWRIKLRPLTAGLRILSLDGGGIRSIIQLTILKELERLIGLDMPIQDFFDLIIGTSGGGIVAFGLGVKRFSVDKCIEFFKSFAQQAFIKRHGVTWPAFGTLIEARHHSVYKSSGIENALREAFGSGLLFGGKPEVGSSHSLKVGVTATSSSNTPHLLANYNRPVSVSESCASTSYIFFRAENLSTELKLWEALRATSAAPTYFKSFYHKPTRLTFNDGGIKYNNPVFLADRERKILWPSLAKQDPDILLSIGTGFDVNNEGLHTNPEPTIKAGVEGYLRRMFNIAIDAIQHNMDCEKTWNDFTGKLCQRDGGQMKYRRLNLNLTDSLPKLDDVPGMCFLEDQTKATFSKSSGIYESVADTLIASLFYFEIRLAATSAKEPGSDCTGTIKCRLEPGSPPLTALYTRLLNRERNEGEKCKPVFLIGGPSERERLPSQTLHSIYNDIFGNKPFHLEVSFKIYHSDEETSIYLSLSDDYARDALISGFPRHLLHEDVIVGSHIRRQSSSSSSSSTPTLSKVRREHHMRTWPNSPTLS